MSGQRKVRHRLDVLALWILFSSWCALSGWSLSLFRSLNGWGYDMALLILAGVLAFRGKSLLFSEEKPVWERRRALWPHFLLPKIWLFLAALAFLGGLLYHPVNYDHLTYRFPRILYWSWEQRWHWIATYSNRMNYSGTGFEWLMMPQLIFFHTDRFFFLINFLSFLFLPGLVFSVFRHLGISPRVNWWWMWILPCGYCYILQASGAGNDSFAAVYLLAALHYAFKADSSPSSRHFVLSLFAAGLLSGAKASNLPLLLPWLIAIFFNRHHLFASCKPALLAFSLILACTISFVPVAFLNLHFTGDYSGDPANSGKMKLSNPVSGITGNAIQLAAGNLSLPLWPKPISWDGVIPVPIKWQLSHDFPRLQTSTGEMQTEEDAGAGLGIVAALAFMILLRFKTFFFIGSRGIIPRNRAAIWIAAAGCIALLVYMSKMGSESAPRLIAAYYPLLVAGILIIVSLDGAVIRRPVCKITGSLVMLSAAPLIVLSPLHPLFPVNFVLNNFSRLGVSPGLIQRCHDVYDTYATRYDDFHDLRASIPETEKSIGFIHLGDDPEVSLWLPLGLHKVIDLTPSQALGDLQASGIHFIAVDNTALTNVYHLTINDLLDKWSAVIVIQKNLTIKIQRGPELWYLIRVP
ncbi:MAG TPA: hypothetical protein VL981_07665 [Candidatus Methylacidiphilales bacterium]|nr:hypothetical protein [Candidatus Methylacidiphilales bacterium]